MSAGPFIIDLNLERGRRARRDKAPTLRIVRSTTPGIVVFEVEHGAFGLSLRWLLRSADAEAMGQMLLRAALSKGRET